MVVVLTIKEVCYLVVSLFDDLVAPLRIYVCDIFFRIKCIFGIKPTFL